MIDVNYPDEATNDYSCISVHVNLPLHDYMQSDFLHIILWTFNFAC